MQESIRDLRVPMKHRWITRIGLTPERNAGAFQLSQEIDAGQHYDLVFGAVALELQGRRLFIGDEMIEDTVEVITSRCIELGATGTIRLTTKVHQRNGNSQKMVHRNKFRNLGSLEDDDYDDWERELALPELEPDDQ
ncbi:hypothetical protein IEZ26_06600 [Nocardioides cavernae]|uniref:Uncharacterized protein n=1 Tax=Nocardioides cavernae TaxID=1921566 RepID=A0ABR8NAS5_9ACTN|nr:hypothetical protein [Nocardioides cavernae]MBD3924285.1 hypothetical protein [Nocardioides cavernae]MBM7510773.1 hypothetical protein [Nocardioides cavernae]